ncbi:Acg family FMN-binding oxidoreductase [Dactylosporangium sp. NPDC048998]|uniref:Acg family FMN-binding oxidoreductase n=1 Tax=Dactylosporangium sp. NPDC048998 TaxID=3363976 RepID=UPI003714C812
MNDRPPITAVLHRAAEDAGLAPSILNTQPWRWRVRADALDLYADPARQLHAIDPFGRLLIVSCGAALHHARVALAYAGYEGRVYRWPDPDQPWLLARIVDFRARPADRGSVLAYRNMRRRHTDRRPVGGRAPVPAAVVAALRAAAEAEGARLHALVRDEIAYLRYAAQGARRIEGASRGHVAELRRWTSRGPGAVDGIAPETVVAPVPRPVPQRDFGMGAAAKLAPGPGDDRLAEYLALATDRDEPGDWLSAGQAVSAVWLSATGHGLTVSPMSDVIEVPGARVLLRGLLHPPGQPHLVLRVGVAGDLAPPPASPRRPGADIVEVEASADG